MIQPITILESAPRPSVGVLMSDAELLRFVNGMITALRDDLIPPVRDSRMACNILPTVMDRLAEQGMKATIGYLGTPVITALNPSHHIQ